MYILYLCRPVTLWPMPDPLNKVSIGTDTEPLANESVQPNYGNKYTNIPILSCGVQNIEK